MKHIFIPIVAAILFIVIIGILFGNSSKFKKTSLIKNTTPQTQTKQATIGSAVVKLRVADTSESRKKGLSGVTGLGTNEGMLFTFEEKLIQPTFWMKDMLIPIDIVWILDNKILQIDKNIQPPAIGTVDSELKLYRPKEAINSVLEFNADFSDKNHLQIGDKFRLE